MLDVWYICVYTFSSHRLEGSSRLRYWSPKTAILRLLKFRVEVMFLLISLCRTVALHAHIWVFWGFIFSFSSISLDAMQIVTVSSCNGCWTWPRTGAWYLQILFFRPANPRDTSLWKRRALFPQDQKRRLACCPCGQFPGAGLPYLSRGAQSLEGFLSAVQDWSDVLTLPGEATGAHDQQCSLTLKLGARGAVLF